jgi:hypothetical protein
MAAIKNLSDHNVALQGKDGKVVHVLPGDVFPEWAKVTNPLVIGDQEIDDDEPEVEAKSDGPPPRRGNKSGTEFWAAYAKEHEVDVPEGASRDEVIAACESAGLPV